MQITRRFTREGQDAFAGIEFAPRSSTIRNPNGSVVFEMTDIMVPAKWSQVARDVLALGTAGPAGAGRAATSPLEPTPAPCTTKPARCSHSTVRKLNFGLGEGESTFAHTVKNDPATYQHTHRLFRRGVFVRIASQERGPEKHNAGEWFPGVVPLTRVGRRRKSPPRFTQENMDGSKQASATATYPRTTRAECRLPNGDP